VKENIFKLPKVKQITYSCYEIPSSDP